MKNNIELVLLLILSSFSLTLSAQEYHPPASEQDFEKQYQERIKKDRLAGIYIPKNLEDAMAEIDKLTSEDAKKIYKGIPEDTIILLMHNRLGQWMIVNWSFYEGSRLSNYLRSAGVTYPDDMADFLLLAYHRHLHGKPISIRELAQEFRTRRKKEWQQEIKEGEILKEEVRQRPKPAAESDKQTPAATPAKSPNLPHPATPKGNGDKQ